MRAGGAVACALLGLVVGLGLNVLIDRVPPRQKLWPLRFRCPRCPEEAEDRRGLPLRAWLRPRGRCPVCNERLPLRYFLVPIANAVLFAAVAVRFGAEWVLPAYLIFFAALLTISVIDLQLQIIPNRIVYPAIFASIPLLVLAAAAGEDWSSLRRALIGAAGAWFALLVIHLISPGGMGFGDVRLAGFTGVMLGWLSIGHVLLGLFLGYLAGALWSLGLLAARKAGWRSLIFFGPFLAAGAVAAVLFGRPILSWYGV